MSILARVPNRSATKPIYLVVVEDPSLTDGIAYYQSQELIEGSAALEFRGFLLTKKQADSLAKDPYAKQSTKQSAKTEPIAVNRKIPWHRVIRIENTTYQKPQGE